MEKLKAIIKKHSNFEDTTKTGTLSEENIQAICDEITGGFHYQNRLWKEANRLYSLKDHSQDGRDMQKSKFVIIEIE